MVGGVGPEARTTLVYDPATDVWSALSPIPTEREHLAAAALDGRIYAVPAVPVGEIWTRLRRT